MTRLATLAVPLTALATLGALAMPPAALAANARNPYGNVDHRVDAGNDTGDSQVDVLNQQQLNRNAAPGPLAGGPYGARPRAYPYVPPASYVPPPAYGYAPPPVMYAPPPAVYAPYYPPYRYYRPYYPY